MPPSFSLSGQLRIVPSWTDSLSTTDVVDSVTIQVPLSFTNGTGPGQADAYWRDVRFVTGSATDVIAVTSLPINVFGGSRTLDLAQLRAIYVRNQSATLKLNYLHDGGAGGPAIELAPGGFFCWIAPQPVAAPPMFSYISPPNEIRVANPGATGASYEIVLVGVKA